MCLDCGCGITDDDHGDPRHITLADLAAAADASGVTLTQAAENILATVYAAVAPTRDAVEKSSNPDRFVLGLAYQVGPDPRIAKGLDGGRDYFTEAELEKAAWSFMLNGQQQGLFHADGTVGAAQPVESSIYRNPIPWVVGPGKVVRKGDWVLGSILDENAWGHYKAGRITGWSPQGVAKRRRPGA